MFESGEEMVGILFVCVFDSKVVDSKAKDDGVGFVGLVWFLWDGSRLPPGVAGVRRWRLGWLAVIRTFLWRFRCRRVLRSLSLPNRRVG